MGGAERRTGVVVDRNGLYMCLAATEREGIGIEIEECMARGIKDRIHPGSESRDHARRESADGVVSRRADERVNTGLGSRRC